MILSGNGHQVEYVFKLLSVTHPQAVWENPKKPWYSTEIRHRLTIKGLTSQQADDISSRLRVTGIQVKVAVA